MAIPGNKSIFFELKRETAVIGHTEEFEFKFGFQFIW
jgi:hypothetical protein